MEFLVQKLKQDFQCKIFKIGTLFFKIYNSKEMPVLKDFNPMVVGAPHPYKRELFSLGQRISNTSSYLENVIKFTKLRVFPTEKKHHCSTGFELE